MKYKINTASGSLWFETADEIRAAFGDGKVYESNVIHQEGAFEPITVRDFLAGVRPQKSESVKRTEFRREALPGKGVQAPSSYIQPPMALKDEKGPLKGPIKYTGVVLVGIALLLDTIAVITGRRDNNSNFASNCATYGGIALLGGIAALIIQFKEWAKAKPADSKSKFRNIAAVVVSDVVSAGILMIFAGSCSLGMSNDPGHPSLFAVGALSLAWGSAVLCFAHHFGRASSSGLALCWIFVILTGMFALYSLGGMSESGSILVPLLYLVLFLIRGGLGCLLGIWALRKLSRHAAALEPPFEQDDARLESLPIPSAALAPEAADHPQSKTVGISVTDSWEVTAYVRAIDLDENACIAQLRQDGSARPLVEKYDKGNAGSVSSDGLVLFACPSCQTEFETRALETGLVFRCMTCKKQILAHVQKVRKKTSF